MNNLDTAALIAGIDKVITSTDTRLTTKERNELITIKEGFEKIEADLHDSTEIKNKKRIELFILLVEIGLVIKEIIDHFL